MAPRRPGADQDEQPDQAQTQQPASQPYPILAAAVARALSSSGGPIVSSQAKYWPSCFAIMGCRPLTFTPWRRLKARQTTKHFAEWTDRVQFGRTPTAWSPDSLLTRNGQQVLFTRQSDGSFDACAIAEDDSKRYAAAK
jgi:hypothetical protein